MRGRDVHKDESGDRPVQSAAAVREGLTAAMARAVRPAAVVIAAVVLVFAAGPVFAAQRS